MRVTYVAVTTHRLRWSHEPFPGPRIYITAYCDGDEVDRQVLENVGDLPNAMMRYDMWSCRESGINLTEAS